ncbi:MAG: hypothetical protein A2096_02070 [Spirochaetes bacterium GWF1_41_5]|nr:MAG: hypothetical protein A2096_02070 [Spirochaetes bacterium GWF1_41_5]
MIKSPAMYRNGILYLLFFTSLWPEIFLTIDSSGSFYNEFRELKAGIIPRLSEIGSGFSLAGEKIFLLPPGQRSREDYNTLLHAQATGQFRFKMFLDAFRQASLYQAPTGSRITNFICLDSPLSRSEAAFLAGAASDTMCIFFIGSSADPATFREISRLFPESKTIRYLIAVKKNQKIFRIYLFENFSLYEINAASKLGRKLAADPENFACLEIGNCNNHPDLIKNRENLSNFEDYFSAAFIGAVYQYTVFSDIDCLFRSFLTSGTPGLIKN